MLDYVWLIPVLPLLGFLINGIGSNILPKFLVALIGCGVILAGFGISLSLFLGFLDGTLQATSLVYFDFISIGSLQIPFAFYVDQLSVLMLLIITGIGFLIHVYSAGYMHDDEGVNRFFAYLNLFIFFMILLVLGANYLILFIGWEGVGLCSYLLIGFWYTNSDYNDAAKKAFIMNRIGDLGYLLGMFLILYYFETLTFQEVFAQAKSAGIDTETVLPLTYITLLLFVGATGKSAQIPLFTWLPDAMAGPTPVSALIHAATMVTAGIYMIARSSLLFVMAPDTLMIISFVGIATALFAATIGLVQNDIKKVLAYSTVSQLGYMFLGLGVGAFTGAFFHVLTHAFFKALLFLGAGSVIHAMSGEQDIRKMGHLKSHLPITFFTFLIGTIAIAGIPPFAGFFSKDLILAHAFETSPILWGLGVIGAAMTAFYMFRLLYLVFFGGFRGTDEQKEHIHESPWSMTFPLIVLALCSMGAGFINVPEVLGGTDWLGHFLAPVFADSLSLQKVHVMSHEMEWMLMAGSVGVAILAIAYASFQYLGGKNVPQEDSEITGLHLVLYKKYYVDEIYTFCIQKPLDKLSIWTYQLLDLKILDGIVHGLGKSSLGLSFLTTRLQRGYIGFYVFAMVLGIILVLFTGLYIK